MSDVQPSSERDELVSKLLEQVSSLERQLAAVTAERDELLSQRSAKTEAPPATAPATAPIPAVAGPGATLAECASDAAFLSPRGRFKLRLCENAAVLVGKSNECIVPFASISRVWLLPEASSVGGSLLIAGLSQPAANGKTNVSYITLHSKPTDAVAQLEVRGAVLSGKPALLVRDVITTMRSELTVTEPGNPNTGGFRPLHGAALQCYNKASEASVYLLDAEMLVREGGRVTVVPYANLRAEVMPPSGRRTFDVQLEWPAPAASAAVPPPKPVKMELSLIAAEEYAGVVAMLKKKRVNVNGSRDAVEEKAAGVASGASAEAEAEADDGSDDDDDDSDDEDDEDFEASDGSEPDEE